VKLPNTACAPFGRLRAGWWESTRFLAVYVAWSWFPQNSFIASRPAGSSPSRSPAGHANRSAFVACIETAIKNACMEQAKTHNSLDKESMIEWANQELGSEINYEEIKNTDTSIFLEGIYEGDSVYLKSANQAAFFESHLTAYLSKNFPNTTVELLAANHKSNWIVMKKLPGVLLRTTKSRKAYELMIRNYTILQRQVMPNVNEVLSLGVIDRRLPILWKEIDDNLELLCATGLDEEDTFKILSIKSELLSMCEEMVGVFPDTLEHGDLHSGNVFIEDNSFRFFDWGDASITHPFLSIRVFWNSLFELLEEDRDENWMRKISEFRPAYLDRWKDYAPISILKRQLLLAEQVGCVYRALSWLLYITPYRTNKEASLNKPAQWLILLLDHRRLSKDVY
jgi:hypothetical protein